MVGYDPKRSLINFAFQAEDSGLFSRETIISICEDLTHAHLIMYCDNHYIDEYLFTFNGVEVRWDSENRRYTFTRYNMLYEFHKQAIEAGLPKEVIQDVRNDDILKEVVTNAASKHVSFIYGGYSIGYDSTKEKFTFKEVSNHG